MCTALFGTMMKSTSALRKLQPDGQLTQRQSPQHIGTQAVWLHSRQSLPPTLPSSFFCKNQPLASFSQHKTRLGGSSNLCSSPGSENLVLKISQVMPTKLLPRLYIARGCVGKEEDSLEANLLLIIFETRQGLSGLCSNNIAL